jgi:hypothetical protein
LPRERRRDVDELTLLRNLVADEPLDDEAARAEVWRRLRVGRTIGPRDRRRRGVIAVAVTAAVVLAAASAFAAVRELLDVGPTAAGRITRTVDGVRFSLTVPARRWGNGPVESVGGTLRTHSSLLSKDVYGSQGAEAVLFWTALPDGGEAAPCTKLFADGLTGSSASLAATMAKAPGITVVNGARRVTVGGRPATHVALRVRRDRGCDPGYFFTWPAECWGGCWVQTDTGDSIDLWVVDVNGKRLVFVGETKPYRNPDATPARRKEWAAIKAEIPGMIQSIQFG